MRLSTKIAMLMIAIAVGIGIFIGTKYYILPTYAIDKGTENVGKVDDKDIQKNKEQVKKNTKAENNLTKEQQLALERLKEKYKGKKLKNDLNDNGIPDDEEQRILGEDYDPYITYDQSNVTSLREIPLDARLDTRYMVGQLYVPAVNLRIVVMEGVNNRNLLLASGTMKPGQVMGKGNYAIAGHHMQNPYLLFTPLLNVQNGAKVYLSDMTTVYEYKVSSVYTVTPDHTEIDDDVPGRNMITLMLCEDLEATHRRIIQGDLVKKYPLSKARKDVKENLN